MGAVSQLYSRPDCVIVPQCMTGTRDGETSRVRGRVFPCSWVFFLFFALGEGGAGRAVCCSILSGGQGWPGLSPPFFFHPGTMLGMLALKSMT